MTKNEARNNILNFRHNQHQEFNNQIDNELKYVYSAINEVSQVGGNVLPLESDEIDGAGVHHLRQKGFLVETRQGSTSKNPLFNIKW